MSRPALAIHGGSGPIEREHTPPVRDRAARLALGAVVEQCAARLLAGGSALDVVEAAVQLLEECDLFNAGRGAVLNRDGAAELDAAIMDGCGRRAGAVAALRTVRHPVQLARCVMERTEHVFVVGAGADALAAEYGLEQMSPDWFLTGERQRQLAAARAEARVSLDHDDRHGTVGAVARDGAGNLAAATSTGGMTNQRAGRVGDSPVVGAGTWADNATCAVSGTGHGEFFLRNAVAHDVHARMAYGGRGLHEAAEEALAEARALGGRGGVIAVGRDGPPVLPFTTSGMYRAWVHGDHAPCIAIYGDER